MLASQNHKSDILNNNSDRPLVFHKNVCLKTKTSEYKGCNGNNAYFVKGLVKTVYQTKTVNFLNTYMIKSIQLAIIQAFTAL